MDILITDDNTHAVKAVRKLLGKEYKFESR